MLQFAHTRLFATPYCGRAATRLNSSMTAWLVEVCESSLHSQQMHEDMAEYYDQQVENRLMALTTMIETQLMLSVGIIIVLFVVALNLMIFDMRVRQK